MAYEVTIPNIDKLLIRDTECYPNVWTFGATDFNTKLRYVFEVSDRINQIEEFRNAVAHWKFHGYTMVGFNSIGYDYPVEHAILTDLTITCAADIFKVSKAIIATPWNDRFINRVPIWKHVIPQIDLFMVHHFDNVSKSTSLKMLEFVMRMLSIEDLPFKPETVLTYDQIDILIEYQDHDVDATEMFTVESMEQLEFRHTVSHEFNQNMMNYNDGKIGEAYFIRALDKAGIQKGKTYRESINVNEIIFPYIKFDHPEFNRLLTDMRASTIYETKGSLKWSAVIDGFSYDLGLGGIHASVKGEIIEADDDYEVLDLDFASWYPHLSFNNNLYPEHLSPVFCDVYKSLYHERKKHKKGTTLNFALKLALNTAYGNSNSEYSAYFYDPKFTMSITINGQLILCMLADQLIKIPNLKMIQCNTDGLTVKFPRKYRENVNAIWKWIEQVTGIELEGVNYEKMIIRDVNNYLAVYEGGGTKHNGAYAYDTTNRGTGLSWNQDHSSLVIQKAACAALIEGKNIRHFIMNHPDIYDFFNCVKVPKNATLETQSPLMWGNSTVLPLVTGDVLQNTTRYYVSNKGVKLIKKLPPLKRKKGVKLKMVYAGWVSKKITGLNKNMEVVTEDEYNRAYRIGYRLKDGGTFTHTDIRSSGVDKDWLVTPCNNLKGITEYDINFEYYISEAEKLVNKVL